MTSYFTNPLFPLSGLIAGYLLVLFSNPVRHSLRDGFRCLLRFKRLWLVFYSLGIAYSAFQFVTFTPLQPTSDLHFEQFLFENWHWPVFAQVWSEALLHTIEGVAGIFDAAAATYPLSVIAAVLLLLNWRGLHVNLARALSKQFGIGGWFIYLGVLLSAVASLFKPLIYWRLPEWLGLVSQARLLQSSAVIDSVAFIFEYLCAVYIQVYLITVAFAWIKGVHFGERALLGFAMRRFSFVLKWIGLVVLASTILVRLPLLLSYFRELPGVLDYLPTARYLMAGVIICFCAMQVSLVLHNESLREAFRAHGQFVRRYFFPLAWFLLVCAIHFWFLTLADATIRAAVTERPLAFILWELIYVLLRSMVTGWLLASWVCLFRRCEAGRVYRESWIQY